jgi:hypothetical protein
MSTDDVHSPTSAGPTAVPFGAPDKGPTFDMPAADDSPAERPEIQVGAAFAGGLLAALILKRLGR